jgi:hypothetical protein
LPAGFIQATKSFRAYQTVDGYPALLLKCAHSDSHFVVIDVSRNSILTGVNK